MEERQIQMMDQFIREIDNLLNHNQFTDIYSIIALDNRFDENENLFVSDFTKILYDAGIDPLQYMNYIPNFFLAGDTMTSLEIPEGIKIIGMQSFFNCNNLQSVQLPNSLQKIDMHAFGYCKSLRDLEIPDNVKIIESNAFANNTSLVHVQLGSGLTEIGQYAFGSCMSLKFINYNGTVSNFSNKVIYGLDWHDYVPANMVACIDGAYYL